MDSFTKLIFDTVFMTLLDQRIIGHFCVELRRYFSVIVKCKRKLCTVQCTYISVISWHRGVRLCILFDIAESISAVSMTNADKKVRGEHTFTGTKQISLNFKFEYLRTIKAIFKSTFSMSIRSPDGLGFSKKIRGKILWHCPFKIKIRVILL